MLYQGEYSELRFDLKFLDRVVIGLVQVKLAVAFAGLLYVALGFREFWEAYYVTAHFLQSSLFAGAAYFALSNASRDSRLRDLGIIFLLVSVTYGATLGDALLLPEKLWGPLISITQSIRIEAMLPWYFLSFAVAFPRSPLSFHLLLPIRVLRFFALISGLFIVLAVGPAQAYWYLTQFSDLPVLLSFLVNLAVIQWQFLMIFLVLGTLLIVYKYFTADRIEKRRARLAIVALSMSFGYAAVSSVLQSFHVRIIPGASLKVEHFVFNLVLSSGLFLLFYAVIAHRVLDVRLIARSAMQHVLARYSATVLGLAPFFFLVVFLFQQRHRTLVQLFSGPEATVLFVTTGVGLLFLRFRGPILDAIDRQFFRERYNARLVLTQLAEQVRGTRSLQELSNMVGQGVDLALHLERVSLLAQDPTVGQLVDPLDKVRPLDAASPLATLLQGHPEPLEVDLDSPNSPLQGLRDPEKHWLIDGQIEMLAPAYALDGSMIGVLALGPKKSELPFLREDRDLLKSVCSATGLVIELLFLKEKSDKTPAPISRRDRGSGDGDQTDYPADQVLENDDAAMECLGCSRIYPPAETHCPRCTVELMPTLVPYVLGGQYRIENRLGAGGMAIVYRATDLKLGREVAIKTLPRVSPEAAMRLHREARTAATVTHPGLAAIYGLETWQGVPMLILEYLPGGTLADQLTMDEPLDALLAIDMGKSVALALQKIHTAGILHRDIKPSNIGYTDEGFAKLLDFGVARLQYDLRQDSETGSGARDDSRSRIMNTASWVIGRTATGQLVGTFGYLSPEAVRGYRPEPGFDIWALSVVLWESLTGENLFADRMVQRTLDRIRDVKVKDIRRTLPECPDPVVDFFRRELHADRGKRAQSGLDMHERLEALRLELVS